jgi:hypothetical protein
MYTHLISASSPIFLEWRIYPLGSLKESFTFLLVCYIGVIRVLYRYNNGVMSVIRVLYECNKGVRMVYISTRQLERILYIPIRCNKGVIRV